MFSLASDTMWTMLNSLKLLICVPALALVLVGSRARAETIAGRASVIDADTLEIHNQRIRILGIDAPESQQRCTDRRGIDIQVWFCGSVAANRLADWIERRIVTCVTTARIAISDG